MNDELAELEAELRRWSPQAPTAETWRRVAADLAQPGPDAAREEPDPAVPRRTRPAGFWLWSAGLAAAGALLWLAWPAPSAPTAEPTTAQPPAPVGERWRLAAHAEDSAGQLIAVGAENILLEARDEGLVALANGTPARRLRQEYIDIYTWRDPRTNASLRWAMPREEIRVVPVSTY